MKFISHHSFQIHGYTHEVGEFQQNGRTSDQGLRYSRMSLWIFGSVEARVYLYIPKDLPNSHKIIMAHSEVGNKWLLRGLNLTLDNVDPDP